MGYTAVPTKTPLEVREALRAGEIVLIDVREPTEYAAERIHGALLFPLSTFDPLMLPQDQAKPIILHCGSGKRSAAAFERCVAVGIVVVAHLDGGIGAWKAAGLPIVSIDPASGLVRDSE